MFEYQASDVATSLISYSPTILQYVIGGSFSAGFTGIIAIVKRFINFISGPTAKIFLPEFSRLYKNGEKKKLEQSYLMIVRIQMVFIGTIGVILIGFPQMVLHLFSPDLESYSTVFTGTAISMLIIAGIGPVTGMLQMTGNERKCNINQWISIIAMALAWCVLRDRSMFVVYGLCFQAVVEGGLKYFLVCRWLKKIVVPIPSYIVMWLPVAVIRVIVDFANLQFSFLAMVVSVLIVLLWNVLFAMRDPMIKVTVENALRKKRKQ